jgi:hypothetical protein
MHLGDDAEFETALRGALALDADEHAYLAGLHLGAAWRSAPSELAQRLAWLGVSFVAATLGIWLLAAPLFGRLLDLALQVGAGVIVPRLLVGVLLSTLESLLTLASNPALGYALPSLALLAMCMFVLPLRKEPIR